MGGKCQRRCTINSSFLTFLEAHSMICDWHIRPTVSTEQTLDWQKTTKRTPIWCFRSLSERNYLLYILRSIEFPFPTEGGKQPIFLKKKVHTWEFKSRLNFTRLLNISTFSQNVGSGNILLSSQYVFWKVIHADDTLICEGWKLFNSTVAGLSCDSLQNCLLKILKSVPQKLFYQKYC